MVSLDGLFHHVTILKNRKYEVFCVMEGHQHRNECRIQRIKILLSKWLYQERFVGKPGDGPVIKAATTLLVSWLRLSNFGCSKVLFQCFKAWKGSSMHNVSWGSAAVDPPIVKDWAPVLSDALQWYSLQDIYRADEKDCTSIICFQIEHSRK
jgi:hypothetical protein